jgi:hypothetical protein
MSVVTSIQDHKRSKQAPENDAALRRLAVQIVVMLPPDTDEAIDVLEHARTLVRTFLAGDQGGVN